MARTSRIVVPRIGPANYWLSDDAWGQLVEWNHEERRGGVAALIDYRYREWVECKWVMKDEGLVELWRDRLAEGWGSPLDPVMYQAVYREWGLRRMRGLNLSERSALGLGLWAEREGIFRRSFERDIGVVGLCGLSLEMIGRGWFGMDK